MEPRIQYAQTEDGVSIAFCTVGEGMPLVHMPTVPFGHIQRRGTGLSEPNVTKRKEAGNE